MASGYRAPRAWHDVQGLQDAPRTKQKASGMIATQEAAARKKIEALKAQRLAKQAAEAAGAAGGGSGQPKEKG